MADSPTLRDQTPRQFRTLLRNFRRPCPCCTHRLHPPIEPPLGPTHQLGAAQSCSLVIIFMIRPRRPTNRTTPIDRGLIMARATLMTQRSPLGRGKCHEGQQAPGVVGQQPDGSEELGHHTVCTTMRCTVPVPTRYCLAILCRPERPGAAKVWRMRRSTSASMKGRRQCLPAAFARAIRFISPTGQLPSRRSEWSLRQVALWSALPR